MTQPETVPQYFLDAARRYGPRKVAIRQKRLGIWEESTWQQSYEQVRDLALGLRELGLQRGDRVALLGDNDRQYIWADLATLCAGGVSVGIFTDVGPDEIQYLVSDAGAAFVFAKDQEQCDKLLDVKERLPLVKKVIFWDDRGMWNYKDPWLLAFDAVQALGRAVAQPDERFAELVAAGRADDPATICYTSGTTGRPKGAVLSHRYQTYLKTAIFGVDPRLPTDNHVSFLSLAWVVEHVYGIAGHVMDHFVLNFPEKPETLQSNIREILPDVLLFNSRLWEELVRTVQVRIADSTWLNRALYERCLPVGYEVADRRSEGRPIGPLLRLKHALANGLLFQPLRDQLGVSRVRAAHTTGAALHPDVVRFFRALGINLKQVYGATESGVAFIHRDTAINFYSVGQIIPGYEGQVSPEGEILISSPAMFLGYHNNPDATAKSVFEDGQGRRWFRTGDAGRFDDHGHLIYFDRMADMIELANGERYSPQFIEGRLKFNPNIRNVMTIGGGDHRYVTAIITIDFEIVGRWAEQRGLAYTTYADLSQKPEVYELLREEVGRINGVLPPATRIRRFVSLPKEFDADEGEMTRTRKLRRGFLQERYADIIGALYGGADSVLVQTPVQYRDGRVGTVEARVAIATMEPVAGEEMARPLMAAGVAA